MQRQYRGFGKAGVAGMVASIRPRFALLALFAAGPALAQQADPIAGTSVSA